MAINSLEAPIIYNLFPKLAGPFKHWESHLRRARDMKFNWIFINPIQLSGFSGSMYSIKDYYEIDPRYISPDGGSPENQLRGVTEQVHGLGMKIMIDLVINHTAIDSVLVEKHPEWYKRDQNGKILNPRAMDGDRVVAVWGDLAEMDNENSPDRTGLWQYWEDLVNHFLDLGFDGFRCDAAYQVPMALWDRLIVNTRKKKLQTQFFAESLGCDFKDVIRLGKAGFDFTFNSSKYWDFEEPWAVEQYERNRKEAAPTISFAESHDTSRLAADLNENWDTVKMRYLFSAVFSTGVMMPIGFEFGFKNKLHVVETHPEDWEEPSADLTDFIRNANQLKLENLVFAEENPLETISLENENILCFRKTSNDQRQAGLVIINKDIQSPQNLRIKNIGALLNRPEQIRDISVKNRLDKVTDDLDLKMKPAQVLLLLGEKR